MKTKFKTEQEDFWNGSFGDEYSVRNTGMNHVASNTVMLSEIFRRTANVSSVIEYGSNIGLNLRAVKNILPDAEISAVEINDSAVSELKKINGIEIFHASILDFEPEKTWDFVLIKGVLIHINPDVLPKVYDLLYKSSAKYICIAEYYNPVPVEVNYRGFEGKLFKRDFAGEMLDRFNDINLLDYGFVYHRDNNCPQDDITWFLLEKR